MLVPWASFNPRCSKNILRPACLSAPVTHVCFNGVYSSCEKQAVIGWETGYHRFGHSQNTWIDQFIDSRNAIHARDMHIGSIPLGGYKACAVHGGEENWEC